VARVDPPEHHEQLHHLLEPLAPAAQHVEVRSVGVDERAQRLERLPHGHVQHQAVVVEGAVLGGVALLALEPPDEAGRGVRGGVHRVEGVHELLHHRPIERPARDADVELS
jgi:hypothetical protein